MENTYWYTHVIYKQMQVDDELILKHHIFSMVLHVEVEDTYVHT